MTSKTPPMTILYQDDDLLILDKPAGIVVNRSNTSSEETMQDWVEEYLKNEALHELTLMVSDNTAKSRRRLPSFRPLAKATGFKRRRDEKVSPTPLPFLSKDEFYQDPQKIFEERSGIAHRLDKQTSGVLVCAKHPTALVILLRQFKLREISKTYTALVHGKLQPETGEIDLPIGRNSKFRLQFSVREDGKTSQTSYQVEHFFPNINEQKLILKRQDHKKIHTQSPINVRRAIKIYQGFSQVKAKPHTGRTHQIRVHFAHINHPLVGDSTYVGKKRKNIDSVWCPRHFLHASELTLNHPRTGNKITFSSPLPQDLQEAMEVLEG